MGWTVATLLPQIVLPRNIDDPPTYGSSVAFNEESNVLVVGSSGYANASLQSYGAVLTYDWNGSSWVNRNILFAYDAGDNDFFGSSVALTKDGKTLFVGASGWDGTVSNQGCVYVYDLEGTSWVFRKMIISPVPATLGFPAGIAIAEDIGEVYFLTTSTLLYVFSLSSLTLAKTVTINSSGSGGAVATTPDGTRKVVTTTTVITTYDLNWIGISSFTRSLYYTTQSSTQLVWTVGAGLALSQDGLYMVAGCPTYTRPNTGQGYIINQGGVASFLWNSTTNAWVHDGTLFLTNSAYGESKFGAAVALSKNLLLAIGAPLFVYSSNIQGMTAICNPLPTVDIEGVVKIGIKFSDFSHRVELVDLVNNVVLRQISSEPVTGKFHMTLYDIGSLIEATVIIYSNEYITDELLE